MDEEKRKDLCRWGCEHLRGGRKSVSLLSQNKIEGGKKLRPIREAFDQDKGGNWQGKREIAQTGPTSEVIREKGTPGRLRAGETVRGGVRVMPPVTKI